ncbi:transcriptional repressor NrdR [Streptomyces oryzae]|uniref:Transcriptional repressor NrdR n=1 Tax=Streptomyces oryzae TaxID=1434886 RepID=A0ABS3X4A9_9ACTN|nr:transcriptional regulator NrdR [Streptomyces oryzae]MBO8190214.1 transcriptional repressor NrdR [Streptomyces oryzae]
MHCPFCRHPDSRVVDSRTADDGAAIRRRRQCPHCSRRFTTVENASLTVIKRSGVTEPFSRDKVIAGVRKACQGRPVTEDALAQLGQRVEEAVRATGSAELSTHDVGLAILGPLQDLDLVAYLRFASVYKAFESLEDFEAAIAELREAHPRNSGPGARDGETAGGQEETSAREGAGRTGRGRTAGADAQAPSGVASPAGGAGARAEGSPDGPSRGADEAPAAAAAD